MYDDECSICLDNITESIKGECILKCSHRIHSLCLQDLLDSNLKQICPICRKAIEIDNFIPPNVEIQSDFISTFQEPIKPIIHIHQTNVTFSRNRVAPLDTTQIPILSFIDKIKIFWRNITL